MSDVTKRATAPFFNGPNEQNQMLAVVTCSACKAQIVSGWSGGVNSNREQNREEAAKGVAARFETHVCPDPEAKP